MSSHIVFGTSGEEPRAKEITAITKAILKRAKREDQVYMFLGDMNIEKQDGAAMKALKGSGLEVPPFGAQLPTTWRATR